MLKIIFFKSLLETLVIERDEGMKLLLICQSLCGNGSSLYAIHPELTH